MLENIGKRNLPHFVIVASQVGVVRRSRVGGVPYDGLHIISLSRRVRSTRNPYATSQQRMPHFSGAVSAVDLIFTAKDGVEHTANGPFRVRAQQYCATDANFSNWKGESARAARQKGTSRLSVFPDAVGFHDGIGILPGGQSVWRRRRESTV